MSSRTVVYRIDLKYIRKWANLTQRELAVQSGLPIRTIQQLENKTRTPHLGMLIKLSNALELHPADFLRSALWEGADEF